MEIQLIHTAVETFDIDFQKIFDYMLNESNDYKSIDDYDIEFGDNVEYYLRNIYDLDFDDGGESYYTLVDYSYDLIADGFYKWLNENKEALKLKN